MGVSGVDLPVLMGLSKAHICTRRVAEYTPTASYLRLRTEIPPPYHAGGGIRGTVRGFSTSSRRRLMQLFAQIPTELIAGKAVLITLTYPDAFPDGWEEWKRHARLFYQWLEKQYEQVSIIWRMEFQSRGAPHFHLMVIGVKTIPKELVKRRWYEIAHAGDNNHGSAAVRVERCRSADKTQSYYSKYVAKLDTVRQSERGGRLWGIRRKSLLPIIVMECEISERTLARLKTLLWLCTPPRKLPNGMWGADAGMWKMVPGTWAGEAIRWARGKWGDYSMLFQMVT